jgi:hypothetical protein
MHLAQGCACMPVGVLNRSVWRARGFVSGARHGHIWLLGLGLALLAHGAGASGALAQSCSADVHCQSGLLTNNVCIGDTLVVKRRLCVGGQCQEQEVRREPCRTSGSIDRCVGNVHERDGGSCDALAGRCVQRLERQLCTKFCSCRNKLLIVATGQCVPGLGCSRAILKCEGGCTCTPQPMCLDAPAKKQ